MCKGKDSCKKIIIVGGGIAGLSAGIYARLAGFDAEIYEKNAITGGECTGWRRKGFLIDNCIHWLTGTRKDTSLYQVWKTVGALEDETQYAPISEFYTSTYQGQSATLWNDLERTEKELIAISPEDESEIRKFIQYIEYAKECVFPAEKPMEMLRLSDYVKMSVAMKDMPKLMKEYGSISLREYAERFQSPVLQHLMMDYLPPEYTAYSFMVSYATMADGNGGVPMGGSLAMAQRMQKRFLALGGKVFANREVACIMVDKGTATGIRLQDGTICNADFVIPAVDFHVLFHKLLEPAWIPAEWKQAYENPDRYPVVSGFQAAYAVDASFAHGATVFIDCKPFWLGNRECNRLYIKSYGYDPAFVQNGKMVLQINVPQTDADYVYWKGLSSEEYKQVKEALITAVTKEIVRAYQELEGNIELLDSWTPLTYERFCGAYHGGYMSFVTTPGAKPLKLKGRIAGISNLFLAGQWINSPGGLPVAVTSGKFAVQRILRQEHSNINI